MNRQMGFPARWSGSVAWFRGLWQGVLAAIAQFGRAEDHDGAYRASRRRLVLVNLAVVSAIVLAMAVAITVVEVHAINDQADRLLYTRAAMLSHELQRQGFIDDINPPPGNLLTDPARYDPATPNIFVIIVNQQGQAVTNVSALTPYGLPYQATIHAVLTGQTVGAVQTVNQHGQSFRLYTTAIVSGNQIIGSLQLGMSLATLGQQIQTLLLTVLGVGVGVLLLTAFASLYLADRALGPLRIAFARQRQFAAAASHELRTPLAFVRSQLELVDRQLERARSGGMLQVATAQTDVQETIEEVDFMARLVRDLLTLAREANDDHAITWTAVDLHALAAEVGAVLGPLAQEHAVRLRLPEPATPETAIVVRGDRDRLRQVMIILMDNAIQHTRADGTVRLEVQTDGGHRLLSSHAHIVVSDTGVGIAPEHLSHIFDAFYRTDASRTPANRADATHTGLGLALARWIAKAHNGAIDVRSTLGVGSTFTVTLPIVRDVESGPIIARQAVPI